MEGTRNVYIILFGKPEEKRLGKPRRKWEDTIETDLNLIGYEVVHWIHLAQDGDL
jgi:hypothetical protein